MQAKFIVIEGLEGAGKSTAIPYIFEILKAKGINDVVHVREPGGTEVSEQIRNIVKYQGDEKIYPETEAMLMYASRIQVVNNIIKPALANNKWVIADRHEYSTIAYQGAGRGLDCDFLNMVKQETLGDFKHDLCIYLDVDPKIGLTRAKIRGELDRFEIEKLEFFEKIRNKYLELVNADKKAVIINGNNDIEDVKAQILKVFNKYIFVN
tara:strand:- start:23587 stop:24213 length:627 start_codon:yes stop_codon:yes gene_type:complete